MMYVAPFLALLLAGAVAAYHRVSLKSWVVLSVFALVMAALFKAMETDMWNTAEKSTQEGVLCNTGTGPCPLGAAAKMKLVNVTDADRKKMADLARNAVLTSWTKECTASLPECAALWNGSIGKVVGATAK